MAERKAVNKYYPPEWTPKQGSINKFRGSHPLRERARKLDQGILVIRFEMPFNIWCGGCGNHIGMGVRYNSEKSKVGMYYTTPIYKFRMKCHLCTNHFEIQSDPQNLDYTVLNGARRQEGRWDPTENEQVTPEDKEVSKKLANDAMFKLEHGVEDKDKKKAAAPIIYKLENLQGRWKDDYALNQHLRKQFRTKKKEIKEAEEVDKKLMLRNSLSIPLLPETADDARIAELMRLTPIDTFEKRQLQKRIEIDSRPVLPSASDMLHEKAKNYVTGSKPNQINKLAQIVIYQKIQATANIKSLDPIQLGIKCKNNNIDSISTSFTNVLNSSLVAADYNSDSSSDL